MDISKIPPFKIRCSAIGSIMGRVGITEIQEQEIEKLTQKKESGKPLTQKQEEKLLELIKKKSNPELPEGAKTYCKNWLKGKLMNRQKFLDNKFLRKGNQVEQDSLDFIARQLNFGAIIKNEQHFENEYIHGTPDGILRDLIVDAKNSWSWETFPLFESEIPSSDYEWQGVGYMELVDKDKFLLCYTLTDIPMFEIEKEARSYCFNNGFGRLEDNPDILQEFISRMTYEDVDDKLKLKFFEIKRDRQKAQEVYKRVKMCREYIKNELLPNIEKL